MENTESKKQMVCTFCGEPIVSDGIGYRALNVKWGEGVYTHTFYDGSTGKHFPGNYYNI